MSSSSDPAERFITAATDAMADNPELQIAARHELAESIAHASPGKADTLDQAAEQLERADRSFPAKWGRIILYVVTGVISAVVLAFSLQSFLDYWNNRWMTVGSGYGRFDTSAFDRRLSSHLSPQDRMILLGDTTQLNKPDRIRKLWESEPENAAYFADFATAFSSDRGALPPDFLETGRKLAPDNGWFVAIAASELSRAGIDQMGRPVLSPGGAKLRKVTDQAKLDEAIRLFHEAAALPQFDSYELTMLKKRIPLLPKRTDTASQFAPMVYLSGMSTLNHHLRQLSYVISIKANQLAKAGDEEGFRQLLADWDKFTEVYLSSPKSNLIEGLMTVAFLREPLKAMSEAASDLGMVEEAKRLKDLDDRYEAWTTARKALSPSYEKLRKRSSLLAGLGLPLISMQTLKEIPIPPEDLTPGRLADHALAGRIMSLAGWLIFGLLLLAAGLYRFRGSLMARRLSARTALLLRPVDWAWILGIGFVLPLLYYQLIYRFTPMGGREWSLSASGCMVPAGQFSSMVLLMALLPILVIRKRLSLREGALGLASPRNLWAWIAVALGALALPVFGMALRTGGTESILIAAGGLLGALLLCLFAIGFRALFSAQAGLLRRATISRLLLPSYSCGMLLMALLVPLYHAEEKHWLAQDSIMTWSVDVPGFHRYEHEVTQQLQKELLEIHHPKP